MKVFCKVCFHDLLKNANVYFYNITFAFFIWLGYCDSNTGMSESESDALPLGDTPIYFNKILLHTELQYKQIYNILILSQSKKKVHTFCVFP